MSLDRGDKVARAFSAAGAYDRHARVQRMAARALARRIVALPLPPEPRLLEIGCGTGFLAEALREQGVRGDWRITDIAPAMLDRARARLGDDPTYALLDGEHGTPENGPFDLIIASLATQWFGDEPAALDRWRQWLSPTGHIMVATLGPETFAEWRAAHDAETSGAGTLAFTSLDALDALAPAEPVIVDIYRERHADARAFLHALRAIGAGTPLAAHRPLSPGALRRVMQRFDASGSVATYQVVTCHLTPNSEAA